MAGGERKIPAPDANPETAALLGGRGEGAPARSGSARPAASRITTRGRSARSAGATAPSGGRRPGRGIVYSYSVMRRVPAPYALAYVTLDEGVTMMTNLVDCDLDAIRIGQRVRVVFKPTDGGPPVPMFTPR